MKKSKQRYWVTFALGILALLATIIVAFKILSSPKSDDSVLIWLFALLILCPAIINGLVAREKGQSAVAWFFAGLFLTSLSTLLLLIMPYSNVRKAEFDEGLGGFTNTHYLIGKSTAYTGELIVTANAIYYFPRTDRLETQRKIIGGVATSFMALGKVAGKTVAGDLGKTLGGELSNALAPNFGTSKNRLYGSLPNEAVEKQLDDYFEKNKRSFAMPAIRARKSDITNLSFTSLGRLTFDVLNTFDSHDFKVGFLKARKLHNILKTERYLV